jgi:hypothetical protein
VNLMIRHILRTTIAAALLLPAAASAMSTPIDLRLLFREPGAPITVAADGSSATLGENAESPTAVLSNIPGFGDPELISASAGAQLLFDYEYFGNVDAAAFSLLDGLTGASLNGFSFFVQSPGTGTISWDLSSLIGTTLGVAFELIPVDEAFDSRVTISNVRIDRPDATSVDEPQTLALLLLGGALLVGGTVRDRRKRSAERVIASA